MQHKIKYRQTTYILAKAVVNQLKCKNAMKKITQMRI